MASALGCGLLFQKRLSYYKYPKNERVGLKFQKRLNVLKPPQRYSSSAAATFAEASQSKVIELIVWC